MAAVYGGGGGLGGRSSVSSNGSGTTSSTMKNRSLKGSAYKNKSEPRRRAQAQSPPLVYSPEIETSTNGNNINTSSSSSSSSGYTMHYPVSVGLDAPRDARVPYAHQLHGDARSNDRMPIVPVKFLQHVEATQDSEAQYQLGLEYLRGERV